MSQLSKRSTVYFDPAIHQALKVKSAICEQSVSELIDEALKLFMREDQKDLQAFSDRENEPEISYESLLSDLIWQDFSGHISKQLFYMLHRIPLELRNQWLNVFSGGYKTPQYIQIWPASHHSLF